MTKNCKFALMISLTLLQAVGLVLSFVPKWCIIQFGTSKRNHYYNLYEGSCVFVVGVIYAICTAAILILLWTGFKRLNTGISILQTVLIIANHILVDGYGYVLELGVGHTLIICVSCVLAVILFLVKEKTSNFSVQKVSPNIEELKKLKELLDNNIITLEEFEAKKNSFLNL